MWKEETGIRVLHPLITLDSGHKIHLCTMWLMLSGATRISCCNCANWWQSREGKLFAATSGPLLGAIPRSLLTSPNITTVITFTVVKSLHVRGERGTTQLSGLLKQRKRGDSRPRGTQIRELYKDIRESKHACRDCCHSVMWFILSQPVCERPAAQVFGPISRRNHVRLWRFAHADNHACVVAPAETV